MALCVGYTGLAQIGQTTVLATSGSYSEQIRTIISSASQNGNIISKKHYAVDYPNVTASITYQLQKGKSNSDFFNMPNESKTLIIQSGETKNLSGYLTSASVSASLGSVINVSFSLVNCKLGSSGSPDAYESASLVPYYSTKISLGQSTSWSLNANREVQFLKSCNGTTSITSADYVGFGMRDRSGSAQLVIGSNSGSGSGSGSGTSTVTFTFDGSITFTKTLINTQSINIQTGSNLTVKNVNILQVG